ncbi:substrate-binding domain-containing protein [Dulcicalothrix desertica]|nr:substrate-binding domain-containing protein [Dulcicalothrix desertica]
MWQKQKKYSPIVCLTLLLALAGTPIAATLFVSQFAVAQTEETKEPEFPLPTSIANNTVVRVDGSSSMARINESLKQSFEQKFSGAKVELATSGTDAALKSVIDGKTDLAAIGRGLTPAEEAQGLEQKRLRREKIAIVVGENNPFKGNITNQQFARMFRGEITDWSQVGGSKGKIRFIDRPTSSDTREALRNYPAFKAAKFATGANATQLSADDTAELVKQLGNDGIGYVIANQVSKVPGLRVLRLHQTLPDDPRYPFSQPLVYAYQKNPSPGVAGFLGFAGAEPGTQAIEAARTAEAAAVAQSVASGVTATTATPNATVTPLVEATTQANTETATTDATGAALQGSGTTSTSSDPASVASGNNLQATTGNNQTGSFPWWLLLPIAALGAGILWWLLGKGNKRSEALEGASTLPITGALDNSVNLPQPTNSFAKQPTNLVDSTNNTATNLAAGAALGGVALASAGATGIGLWPRLANGNVEEPSENIDVHQTQANGNSEVSVDREPAAVVMQTHSESNLPQVDLESTASVEAPLREAVIDVELPNADRELTQGNSNWLDNLNAAGSAVAVGEPVETTNVVSTEPELTVLNVDLSSLPQNEQPLPDVWEDTEEEPTQTGSNWLDNISQAGAGALAGGAVAGGAAAAGAGLWSQFANREQHNNDNQESETDLMLAQTTEIPPTQPVETTLQIDSSEPEVLESTVDTSEIIETISIEPTATSIQTPEIIQEEPDVSQNDSQETQQTGSNWLDSIRDASQNTIAGGAALASGAVLSGAGLWSRFANGNNNNEPADQTNEIVVDSDEQDLVPPVNVDVPEVPQPILEQPSVTEPSIEVEDVATPESSSSWLENIAATNAAVDNNNEPADQTNEIVVDSDEQNFVPLIDVDVPEIPQPTLEQPSVTEPSIEVEDVATPESGSFEPSNEAEFNVAEVVDTDNASNDTQQFDTTITGVTDTTDTIDSTDSTDSTDNSDVILTGDIDNRQWWAPSDSDAETTQAETVEVENTQPSSIPEFNINPGVVAGGAAIAGVGAAIAGYNHGNKTDVNVVSQPPVADTTPTAPINLPSTTSQITFTARTPKWAYVAWNIEEQDRQLKNQGGAAQLALRLYDTTDTDLSYQAPQLVQQYECEETIDDRFVAIPGSDRDYMAEIGYLTSDNQWLSIAKSHIVRVFSRPHQEFWFEADAELIIHGATEPGSSVTIGGQSVKLKPDGTFHLRIPFTEELIDYVMTAVAKNGEKAKTIHMHFEQNK